MEGDFSPIDIDNLDMQNDFSKTLTLIPFQQGPVNPTDAQDIEAYKEIHVVTRRESKKYLKDLIYNDG